MAESSVCAAWRVLDRYWHALLERHNDKNLGVDALTVRVNALR